MSSKVLIIERFVAIEDVGPGRLIYGMPKKRVKILSHSNSEFCLELLLRSFCTDVHTVINTNIHTVMCHSHEYSFNFPTCIHSFIRHIYTYMQNLHAH